MTAVTSNIGTRHAHGTILLVRRLALATGRLARAIGSRWNAIVDGGQLGPADGQPINKQPWSLF